VDLVIRAAVVFLLLLLVTRVVGRRELNTMEPFDVILLVVVGDLVQQGVTQDDRSISGAFLAVGTIAALVAISSGITYLWPRSRPVLEGMPVIVIRDGRVIDEALRTERIPFDELLEEARREGINDLREVKVGIIETDGKMSFIKENGNSGGQHAADKSQTAS
jgi:uncharacterized membrane protein YcaP (DUF421 family)